MSSQSLPAGYGLQEYRIEKLLGVGGFGLTYLATDSNLNLKVALKEYLPGDIALRARRDRPNRRDETHEDEPRREMHETIYSGSQLVTPAIVCTIGSTSADHSFHVQRAKGQGRNGRAPL